MSESSVSVALVLPVGDRSTKAAVEHGYHTHHTATSVALLRSWQRDGDGGIIYKHYILQTANLVYIDCIGYHI
jgi:hypothetical protein